MIRLNLLLSAAATLLALGCTAAAQGTAAPADPAAEWWPQTLGLQATSITQRLDTFRSAHDGRNSLPSRGDQAETDTYGLSLGARLGPRLHAYMDFEMARGTAPGKGVGLGSLTNGDVIRVGTVNLGQDPYLARGYLRYIVPLSAEAAPVERLPGQSPQSLAAERLEIKFGKLALTDDFDLNRYANTTRGQFMTWSLFNNTAWDFAADTRGYTYAVTAAWIGRRAELRLAEAQVVTLANGNVFDRDLSRAHSENAEATWRLPRAGAVVRLLAYQNTGRMGDYREALALARSTGSPPSIAADEKPGRVKVGYGFNAELPLAAGGETGIFVRAGASDGATETFMFAEVDQLVSAGLQLCGCHWGRERDRAGAGVAVDDLSRVHRAYLAAGGIGFLIGDGSLAYGSEAVTEVYYRWQVGRALQVSADYQYIVNPAYNRDRGPAQVFGLRLRVSDP